MRINTIKQGNYVSLSAIRAITARNVEGANKRQSKGTERWTTQTIGSEHTDKQEAFRRFGELTGRKDIASVEVYAWDDNGECELLTAWGA